MQVSRRSCLFQLLLEQEVVLVQALVPFLALAEVQEALELAVVPRLEREEVASLSKRHRLL